MRQFVRDLVGVTGSRGYLRALLNKGSDALEPTFAEWLNALPDQPAIHLDETGHPDTGDRCWTWCFNADRSPLCRIDPSRGSPGLLGVLGAELTGVIGCEYARAYRPIQAAERLGRGPVLPGPSDSRRDGSHDLERCADPGLWRAAASRAERAVRGDSSA